MPSTTLLVGAAAFLGLLALARKRDEPAPFDQFSSTEPKDGAPPPPPAPVDASKPPPWERMALRAPLQLLTQRTYCAAIQLTAFQDKHATFPDDLEAPFREVTKWRFLEVESPPPDGLPAKMAPGLYFVVGSPALTAIVTEIPEAIVAIWSQPSTR